MVICVPESKRQTDELSIRLDENGDMHPDDKLAMAQRLGVRQDQIHYDPAMRHVHIDGAATEVETEVGFIDAKDPSAKRDDLSFALADLPEPERQAGEDADRDDMAALWQKANGIADRISGRTGTHVTVRLDPCDDFVWIWQVGGLSCTDRLHASTVRRYDVATLWRDWFAPMFPAAPTPITPQPTIAVTGSVEIPWVETTLQLAVQHIRADVPPHLEPCACIVCRLPRGPAWGELELRRRIEQLGGDAHRAMVAFGAWLTGARTDRDLWPEE